MDSTPLQALLPKLPSGILYGGDYNPEQWPEEVWAEDARLMRDAGVNLVSLAIFSWAKLQPQPNIFTLDWLDRVISVLWEQGVSVCLATSTASPPAWLSRLYPDTLPVGQKGERFTVGSRQHYCPNSARYYEASRRLITTLAQRYGQHPAVALWHLNNELGCHINACYCETCAEEFRNALKRRYGTLDVLNETWGTAFWSQAYSDWQEVTLPGRTPTFVNPAQALDHARFVSDSLRGVLEREAAAVRAVLPDAKVTTNGVGIMKPADYRDWYRLCDVAALDAYPDPAAGLPEIRMNALAFDFYRSFKDGLPFLLMEQVTSQVNWRQTNVLKQPGQMRAMSYGAMARGADGIMFFQWRASKAGAEKFHGAMLPHAGEDTRVFREVKQLGNELRGLERIAGARTPARVALIGGWENRWALELESKPATFRFEETLAAFHAPLWANNVGVDIREAGDDLSAYDVVIAPVLYQLTEPQAENLRQFVGRGGTLVMTYFSGIVNEHEQVWLGGYPALLQDVLGLKVEEWQPIPPGTKNSLVLEGSSKGFACEFFSEVVRPAGAEVLATFESDLVAGGPAITRHSFRDGEAIYLATRPDPVFLTAFLREVLAAKGIASPVEAAEGVEAAVRAAGHEEFLFVINHTGESAAVSYKNWSGCGDLLAGGPAPASEVMAPFAVRILHRARS